METCDNCGRTIGNLETPCVHNEHIVCVECKERLSGDATAPAVNHAHSASDPATAKPHDVSRSSNGRAIIVEYSADQDRAIKAVAAVVARLGYTLQGVDRENGLVTFETGMSWQSWAGQSMSVHVMDCGNRVQITVGGTRKAHGAQMQMYDWGESRKIASKLLDHLDSMLGQGRIISGSTTSGGGIAFVFIVLFVIIAVVLVILSQ